MALTKIAVMLLLPAFCVAVTPAAAGPVVVISEEGTGHARVTAAGETDEQTVQAMRSGNVLFGEAHAVRSLPANGGLFSFDATGRSQSQHLSELFTDTFDIQVGTSFDLAFDDAGTGDPAATASATGTYRLSFSLDRVADFTLERSSSINQTNGGEGNFSFSFTGPDGVIDSADSSSAGQSWNPQQLAGTLQPGAYELLLNAGANGGDLQEGSANARASLSISVPIPLPPGVWSGLLMLGGGGAGVLLRQRMRMT
jgi:hypothetical protein